MERQDDNNSLFPRETSSLINMRCRQSNKVYEWVYTIAGNVSLSLGRYCCCLGRGAEKVVREKILWVPNNCSGYLRKSSPASCGSTRVLNIFAEFNCVYSLSHPSMTFVSELGLNVSLRGLNR